MKTKIQTLATGTRLQSPGRCRHCGRLMIMVKRHDPVMGRVGPLGWWCLLCGTFVDLHNPVAITGGRPQQDFSGKSHRPSVMANRE